MTLSRFQTIMQKLENGIVFGEDPETQGPNIIPYPFFVRHLNGDTLDNRPENMEFVHIKDAFKNLHWTVDWTMYMSDEDRDFILEIFWATPEIFTYMKFRAEKEELPFSLTPMFFKRLIHRGVRSFYGVQTNHKGKVLWDTKKPELLTAFRE